MRALDKKRAEGRDGLILTRKEKLISFMRALLRSTVCAFQVCASAERWYGHEPDFREKPRDS